MCLVAAGTAIRYYKTGNNCLCKRPINPKKAIQTEPGTDLDEESEKYKTVCDYFLFDTASKQYGGSGIQFDWKNLEKANISKPFFLSGGIGLEDVEKVKAFHNPMLFAIDVNSRFETSPGVKDLQQVASFLKQIS